jgi:hypothetical protein
MKVNKKLFIDGWYMVDSITTYYPCLDELASYCFDLEQKGVKFCIATKIRKDVEHKLKLLRADWINSYKEKVQKDREKRLKDSDLSEADWWLT